jgi:hypothetical protein
MPVYERVFDIEYPLPKLDTLIVSPFAYTSGLYSSIRPRTSKRARWRTGQDRLRCTEGTI